MIFFKIIARKQERKLNDEIAKQHEEEEETQRLNYENLPDNEIKERLLKTIIYDFFLRIKVNQWLEIDRTLLLFIRQHASLLVTYSSLKMELNSEKEFGIITEELAKSISDQQQLSSSSSSTVDIKLITSSILIFVREDLQRLNLKLIKKRHLFMLNVKDICLLHEFYYLQPDSQQLQIVEDIWQATIAEQNAKKTILNNQQNIFQNVNYGHQIELQKQMFLALKKKDEKEKNILSFNYLKLNIDLLMNIIESRQKVLIQRLEFEDHFNQLFPHNNDDDDDDDDHNKNDNYHENNRGNSNQKDVDQQSSQKYQYDLLK
ncbi:unnamed protein product [Rotaria sordida]|uniref:Uncharacterized protein n=1 Tax=Rotaria sordida TaxID=392033 RepID=A0A815EZ90_9BILA|nr:unnamed protein product [Rotaria sordida]CAF1583246.1 unnamed protein product [Rotaria sordida]